MKGWNGHDISAYAESAAIYLGYKDGKGRTLDPSGSFEPMMSKEE